MLGTGSASSPSPLPGAGAPRSEKKARPLAPAAKELAPPLAPAPKQAPAPARPAQNESAAAENDAKPPSSARKPTPSYIEPPPIPESVRFEEEDENDATIREQPPGDWMHASPPQQRSAAPSAAPAVPIVAQAAGRRTVAGMGVPPHPALSATLPFANITPGPFAAAPPAVASQESLLQPAMPQASTPPTATASAPAAPDPRLPQPSTLPSLAASSTGAPPVPVASASPSGPAAPSSQTYVSPPPSSARPSTRAGAGSMAPGARSLPAGISSLRGYEPTFAMAPEELVPRVSPSARVVRPRSGWERALGRRGSRLSRAVFAGAAACVALASAIVIVMFLRRPAPSAALELDSAAAIQREPAPEAAPPDAQEPDAPAPPAAADDAHEPSADEQGEPPGAAPNPALAGDSASPPLDDRQLAQLFALEQYEPWPSCPERAAPGKTKAKSKAKAKKSSARGAKEAVRLLKAARAELIKGNNEKAQSLLCRATAQDPSNSQAQQALAELALRFGNGAQAQAAIQRALARKPEDPTLLGIQGDALVLAGDLPGSRRVWLRANPSPGTDEERMRSLAGTYRKLGDRLLGSSSYAAACALFRRSLVLSSCGSSPRPECKGSYAPGIGLAESLRRLRQPRAALAWAERAANAFPRDARVQVLLGDILFENGQKQEAKNAWAAARKAQPSNALAAQRLAKGKP
jgi:tetratricopeptide (TPR) repeat protein